jgi:hypothetical protein
MANKISYGQHLFPGGPDLYIRTGSSDLRENESHFNIQRSLAMAFSNEFSNSIFSQLAQQFHFNPNSDVHLSFMNYGDTQLVYRATIANDTQFAVLINQPQTPLGVVKKEFDNLQQLVEIDPRFVVKPHAFNRVGKHELYASEYIDNAFCIAHLNRGNNPHGVYDPVPYYHFENFPPQIIDKVNASMIALLVNYYDERKKLGIAKTQTSGNDFLLTRDFSMDNPDSVLPNIKIIAARDTVNITLNEYLDLIRYEFALETFRSDEEVKSGQIKVNHHSKTPMTSGQIEEGIEIGMGLRKQEK